MSKHGLSGRHHRRTSGCKPRPSLCIHQCPHQLQHRTSAQLSFFFLMGLKIASGFLTAALNFPQTFFFSGACFHSPFPNMNVEKMVSKKTEPDIFESRPFTHVAPNRRDPRQMQSHILQVPCFGSGEGWHLGRAFRRGLGMTQRVCCRNHSVCLQRNEDGEQEHRVIHQDDTFIIHLLFECIWPYLQH